MAFKDITKIFYDGNVKIDYIDKTHRYYARTRKDFKLPVDDPRAWDKAVYPKGVTTILGDTLEKKGLMTWPMGMALSELFGFYDFTGDNGERKTGYSIKDGNGTMWDKDGNLIVADKETALPIILSASKNWTRRQKKGADIGSYVHNKIEEFINATPAQPLEDIGLIVAGENMRLSVAEYEEGQLWHEEFVDTTTTPERLKEISFERNEWLKIAEKEVEMAQLALNSFISWWTDKKPVLIGAEDLVYSREYNICGTFDALIEIDGKRVLCDWKTSNASTSKEAAMPEGINYQYFDQSAIYALAWAEMGNEPVDDLMIVSCRKDGGFTPLFASDLGLTVEDCMNWAKATILCHQVATKVKAALWEHAEGNN